MFKKLLALMAFFAFAFGQISAQVSPACGTPPPPGAESCPNACVYCNFDGYMGINNGSPSGGNDVCGAIAIHNDQWFGFTAGSESITITLLTTNCLNGDGLQAAFFDDCSDPDAIVCNPGSPNGGAGPLILTYSNFTIGETYYLMLDGWDADVCNFEIEITDGSITPGPPGNANAPQGPTLVCPGSVVEYHIDDVPGAGNYIWSAPPGSQINGGGASLNIDAPEGNTVTITFGNVGGNVCVQADNACNPATAPACLAVVNQPIPPTILPNKVVCFEDSPFTWDEEPMPTLVVPGTFTLTSTPYQSYLGCDSVVRQTIIIKQILPTNLGAKFVCKGSCFTLAGTDYCTSGGYSETFTSFQGCDSTVTFSVTVLEPKAVILPPANAIDCNSTGVILSSTGSTPLGQAFYNWTGANWGVLGGAATYNATLTGTYHLIVTAQGGGVQCRDTATVVVTGNTIAPNVSAIGANINCVSPLATLSGISSTPGVTFTWTGPGINAGNQFLQNPSVNQPGTYVLTVKNPANGCTATASAIVLGDVTPPAANAVGGIITCSQPSLTINGTTNVPTATWFWTGPGINAGNQTMEDPNVNQSGSYAVTVTNTVSGCTNTATVVVDLNNTLPTGAAGPNQTLTCTTPNVTLQGAGNAGGQPITFDWTGPNGFISSIEQPNVTVAGSYILTVLNTQNGCIKKDTVDVVSNQALPTASAGADSIITCAEPSVTLIGSGSSGGPNFTATWSGPGINAGNSNQYNPTVDQQGTYTVLISNTTNGCTATDQATVGINTSLPTANAGADDVLTCTNTNGVVLDGSGIPGTVTYFWTGPGIGANNLMMQNPTVTQPGTYDLVVTNPVNGCTATDQVIVTQDANVPTAVGGPDQVLNCSVFTVDFNGSGSTTGPEITYNWSGPGISGANSTAQSPTGLTMPGIYNLTVTNTNNNCFNTDVVVIQLDNVLPNANAGNPLTLNCFNNAIDTLDASASSLGSMFSLLWSGPGINAGNQNSTYPVINNLPGLYTLVVTNTTNTCTASTQVNVTVDLVAPTADAGVDNIVDCITTSVTIGGNSSTGANFSYLWTGAGINLSNQALAAPTISLPGTYTIVVTNSVNGCTATNDAVVTSNAVFPTALAGADGLLTCSNTAQLLDGSASSIGVNFQTLWTGPGINAGNQNQVSPSVTAPGTYILAVTNTTNSCVTQDTVIVTQNITIPTANAGQDMVLDCQTISTTLDGSFSTVGPNIVYLWAGAGINASNQNNQNPPIDQPGTYTLLITNTANGCTSNDQVVVNQDIVVPTAAAGLDLLITCANLTQTIDGSGSSTGAIITYVWQGPGIDSGNFNLQNPTVNIPGSYTLTVTNMQNHCAATDAVFVDENSTPPLIAAGPDLTLTCTANTVQLDATQSASGPNISFSWSGPGIVPGGTNSPTPTVNLAGVYVLTITDAINGCTNVDAVNVSEDILLPTVIAGNDLVITCANASQGVSLNSSGSSTGANFMLVWNGAGITAANQNLPSPTVLVPGTYTLSITNTLNGCVETDEAIVNADQNLPTASAGLDQVITCAATEAVLDGTGSSSPNGTLIFTWAGPGINAGNINGDMPTVLVSGTYSLTVENSLTGCKASDQVVVTIDNQQPTATATADLITCADPSSTVTATSSLLGSLYLWEGPDVNAGNETNQTLQVTVAGTYVVTVTAQNGCTGTASTIVALDADVPQGAAEGGVLNCLNGGTSIISGSVTSPAGTTFTWTGPGIGTVTTGQVSVSQAGIYTFTMVAPNGCVRPLTVNVTANFQEPTVAVIATEEIDCNTAEVTINGNGSSTGPNFTYVWSTTNGRFVSGTNTLTPLVDRAGEYQLLVINNLNGCRDSMPVTVQVDPLVPSGFDLVVSNIKCFGDTNGAITVNGVQGGTQPFIFSLSGNTGSANNQYTGLNAGEYILSLEDANGCQLDTTITIGEPGQLQVQLGPDIEVSLGESATVTAQIQSTIGVSSVNWNYAPGCDSLDLLCETFTYQPFDSYRHEVRVTDGNGCIARDEILVLVEKKRDVYVPNIFNPNSDLNFSLGVFVGIDVAKINYFNVFDRWGNQMFNLKEYVPTAGATPDASQTWDGTFRGDKAQVGVYVWYCEVEFIDGQTEHFKGDVTLIR